MDNKAKIAYFSMEIGIDSSITTYAGGLGILAGDTIKSAADMGIPMVAVTLLHRKGYFRQKIDATGWQTEESIPWPIEHYLSSTAAAATVKIEDRLVKLQAWYYEVIGVTGKSVPVIFLDADIAGNSESDRKLTDHLYGGDDYYRLCQEAILGIGGIRILRSLGFNHITRYHMNEGHASLLVLELLTEYLNETNESQITQTHLDNVHSKCVFTTHTPVPAGHDQFSIDLAKKILGHMPIVRQRLDQLCCDNRFNLTYLALQNSHYVNGVAKKHRDVSRQMFAGYQIDSITNGIHAATWACQPMQELFDQHIQGWKQDNASLRYALNIPLEEIWQAHRRAKSSLLNYVNDQMNVTMSEDILTLGFARRATAYKRPGLIFTDIERLKSIAEQAGALQIIFAGKAHPRDHDGKLLIQSVIQMAKTLGDKIKLVYLSGYNIDLAKLLIAGVDVWLNTPQPPLEASGTSGMKAAINGVPSFSILDGWWLEGCIENVTGWGIDGIMDVNQEVNFTVENRKQDALLLYDRLEQSVIPLYYNDHDNFTIMMRNCIAINASFFNTERMLGQYISRAYYM